ncbi:CapA family protein [Clostridium sp. SYSU_GA19001]|uniref:CapA family protein n=1 Tax=Clostridium caldaquaticum TaxID=2940653 RepID=UPI0020772784|nr:CapA family protein [Clostridium caldaquaticum]MCM8711171.1 CapA family protein [Clostridium caldaquaticum]
MKKQIKNTIIIIATLGILSVSSFSITYKIAEKMDKQTFNQNTQKETTKLSEQNSDNKALENKVVTTETSKTLKLSEITLSSTGNSIIGWDSKISYNGSLTQVLEKYDKDYSYIYKNVADIFKEDDITTTNLETTFTNATLKTGKTPMFKAPPTYAKALNIGNIEAVNLSNNHTKDYLDKGFQDTKNALKTENINFFGEGEKWVTEVKGNKLGFLGYQAYTYDNAFMSKLKEDIASLKSENCTVIINFHWGTEGASTPNNAQKNLAHYAIDNGADLIIGHHPNAIQGIEKYKGKIIAYSLGNFIYGNNKNFTDKDTFILQTNFKFENNKLKSYGIKIIPCSISSVSNANDYCPTPLEGTKKTAFLTRLNKLSTNLDFKLEDDFFYIDVNNN